MIAEEWEEVSLGYEVSSLGRVRSWVAKGKPKPLILSATVGSNGRPTVKIHGQTFAVHTLVAKVFLGPRPDGMEICHWNDDKMDNRVVNLYFGTHTENCSDRDANGRTAIGVRNGWARLDDGKVRAIREARIHGNTYQKIGDDFGISRTSASLICRGKAWKHVAEASR